MFLVVPSGYMEQAPNLSRGTKVRASVQPHLTPGKIHNNIRKDTVDCRRSFLKSGVNMVDLVSILPFYFEAAGTLLHLNSNTLQDWQGAVIVLRLVRILR